MKEFIEKLIGRLEEYIETAEAEGDYTYIEPFEIVKNAVKELAEEHKGGWIPCSERLPEDATVYEVTEEIVLCSKKQYIVEHRLFGTEGEWLCPSNRKVIAWQPLPPKYEPKGE